MTLYITVTTPSEYIIYERNFNSLSNFITNYMTVIREKEDGKINDLFDVRTTLKISTYFLNKGQD